MNVPDQEKQDRLTALLRTAQRNFVRIRSFIKVMDIGLQYAGGEIQPEMEESMHGFASTFPWETASMGRERKN